MLGQHPQMYGLPDLELFAAETVGEWWELCAEATFPRAHGALRAVAELFSGEQTEETIKFAADTEDPSAPHGRSYERLKIRRIEGTLAVVKENIRPRLSYCGQ